MRLGTLVRSAAAGAAIYVLMAACAASERSRSTPTGDDGTASSSSGGLQDAIADVLAEVSDPVNEASAGPLPPDVATENCSKTYSIGPTLYRYAEHAYPGATAAELAASVVVLGTNPNGPPGFATTQTGAWVRDGAVALVCGVDSNPQFSAATFVRSK